MGIISFEKNGRAALGVTFGQEVVDLSEEAPFLPGDVSALLRGGPNAVPAAYAAAAKATKRVALSSLKLLPPSTTAAKNICLGLNYVDHAAEGGRQAPDYPVLFYRGATSFVAHGQPLVRPILSEQFDYEGELVAFIGARGRHVPKDKALSIVAGYSVFNDGSIRDYQRRTPQWTVGKNFDGTGGFGPEFIPADQLPPGARGLRLQTRLNGQVVQNADTSDMIFDVATTIEIITQAMTLEPGDILIMGTPAGVGAARKPQLWMKAGDVCEVEIEKVGLLRNPVIDEKR